MVRSVVIVLAASWLCGCGSDAESSSASAARAGSASRGKQPKKSRCKSGEPYEFEQSGSHKVVGCRLADGKFDGPYEVVRDGVKIVEGQFVRGVRDGQWIDRHVTGKVWRKGAYRDGVKHGTWIEFAPDGKQLGSYQMNMGTGTEIDWAEDGTVRRRSEYVKGKRNGATTEYFETGEKMTEAHYKDDELEGEWTFWDQKGQTRKIESWHAGAIGNTTWFEDGEPLTD